MTITGAMKSTVAAIVRFHCTWWSERNCESPQHWTLSLGLAQFRTIYQVQWNLTMAATLLFMAPVIIVFFLAQRAFVEGVTLTGVKG